MHNKNQEPNLSILDTLNEIGIALSAEKNMDSLLERILINAKKLTGADGGTLYLYNAKSQSLEFKIVRTDSLGIKLGGETGAPINANFRPLPSIWKTAHPTSR